MSRQPGYTCDITRWYIQDMRVDLTTMLISYIRCTMSTDLLKGGGSSY